MMVHRVAGMEMTWSGTLIGEVPRVPTDLDLTLDDAPLLKAIHQLHFVQMKREFVNLEILGTKRFFLCFPSLILSRLSCKY